MNLKLSAVTSFAIASLLALPAVAAAGSPQVDVEKVSLAGSFLTSRIDNNGDGQGSSWCTLQIKGGYQGSSMQQCVNEDVFAEVTADCPGGLFVVSSGHRLWCSDLSKCSRPSFSAINGTRALRECPWRSRGHGSRGNYWGNRTI